MNFRSGIERIFAEHLDEEKIPYEYEEVVVEMDNGCRYITDFYIEPGIVVELKGRAREGDIYKASQFMKKRPDHTYIVVGDTNIYEMEADFHFDFDTQIDEAVGTLDRLRR